MSLFPRFAARRIRAAFADTRVVLIAGPRQAGKTTLAQQIAREEGLAFFTLDNTTTLEAAQNDPVGFLRGINRAVIDEIQRAPELLLALKESVDSDPRPGRFLLTGSADLMTLPRVADSLAGRMEIVRLLPLAVSEIGRQEKDFFGPAFRGEPPSSGESLVAQALVETVFKGGYPEAVRRAGPSRRQTWHLDYLDAVLGRDVQDIAQIEDMARMPQLMALLAEHAGQLVNYSTLGAGIGVSHVTTRKYVGVFENLFLVRTLPPWHSNRLKRLIKTPKLHFLDSGLLASLRDITPEQLRRDRGPFGAILESFVFTELLKLASWSDAARFRFSHFRDKERNEVDIVIEDAHGRVVGVEVKASATVTAADFKGLKQLQAACGDKFACGLVLYDHDKTIPFGERLFAAPISVLW
ncbi:MAG: ATP-binding protein [Parvibaculaceae bacterium]